MCLKFFVSITGLVMASILLASITDASSDHDGNKSFCMPNKQKANWVAAKTAATVAKPAVEGAPHAVVGKTGKAGQQDQRDLQDLKDQQELSHQIQEASQDAIEVMGRKIHELETLIHLLAKNQEAIEEGERAAALTMCAINRVVWMRKVTSHGLQNMIRMYMKWHGTEADLNYLAAFALNEEAEKTKLLGAAFLRLENLKKSIKHAQGELKSIRQSARKANNAAEEARQKIVLLRHMAPMIKMLNHENLRVVKEFIVQHQHAAKRRSS